MLKKYFFCFIFLGLILAGVYADNARAVVAPANTELERQLNAFSGEQGANYGKPADPRIVIANIIRIALTLIGVLFVSYTVYAGYLIMTAAGEEDKVNKGKKTIQMAIIGLLVTMSAYAITRFVTNALISATGDQGFEAGIEVQPERRPTNQDPLGNTQPSFEVFPPSN